jgi:hypothetical protein
MEFVAAAIRRTAMRTVSPLTEVDNIFTIKLKTKRTVFSSGTPATVLLELKESKKVENATVVKLIAANIGFGPLQVRECQLKLDATKEAILFDLEELSKQGFNKMIKNKTKTYKCRRLKRRSYHIGTRSK